MNLWEISEPSLLNLKDKVWIQFYNTVNPEKSRALTFGRAYDMSTVVVETLEGVGNLDILGLMFDDETTGVVGFFPSLLAALR